MVGTARVAVVWDGTGAAAEQLRGHDRSVSAGVFSSDGRRLFTLDGDGWGRLIHVWDTATGREVLTLRESQTASLNGTASNASGEPMWLDGDRLMLLTHGGVLVFDGTPREPP
ncbi:MAG TPA: hypothetical protein VD866_14450 [Urbifossiella sp.]|nr:hypothetical protein [Urbifossiella sp.]